SINDYDAPATELTFEAYETITAIGEIGSDLLVATTLPYGCKIRRIDTGDVAVISEDFIPEYKISLFLPSDNVVLCVTELHGNVYQYDGYQLHKIFRQQNTNIDNRIVTIEENAQTARLGISYYGVSSAGPSVTPDGVCGTYSMGAASANLPTIINQEFIPSPGLTDLIKVHGLLNNNSSGLDDLLYVAWEDDTVGATQEYGIDKLSSNRYDGAYFTTMVIDTNRIMLKHFKIYVNYRSLASGTDITIYSKVNNGSWTEVTSVNDATRNFKFGSVDVIEAATLQVKVELTTSGEDTPEIESLVIDAS
ncbi:MAG: hypothetical protein GY861_18645, partial [bacterium]|nr:hypothetical protein [bacterium]